jgi:hypothetical protein
MGIPGSGFAGASSALIRGAQVASVAASQTVALAVSPESGQLASIKLRGGAPVLNPISGALAGVDRIAISPNGGSAVVYASVSKHAQIISGLPDSPAASQEMDWVGLPGTITALAVDDAGDAILAATADSDARVFAIGGGSAAALVLTARSVSDIAFLHGSASALLAEPLDNEVILLRSTAGVFTPIPLGGERAGVKAPMAVMPSADGLSAFAVNAAGDLWSIPFAGAAPLHATCSCSPSRLQPLRGADTFLLTESLDGPLAVLTVRNNTMEVVWMPYEPARAGASPEAERQ